MTAPRRSTVAVALLGGLVLVGCAGEQPTASPPPGGAESTTEHEHAHSDLPEPPEDAAWNAADATYLSMMIGHHKQALDMSRLAPSRASDPRVKALARTIDAGQGREIIVMATWLVDRGYPEPTLEEVDAMGSMSRMSGMLAPAQMSALADAEGIAFDRLYLSGMIQHHQGAVGMAEDVLGAGEDERVNQMAAEVIASQNGEIRRMRDLLADLP